MHFLFRAILFAILVFLVEYYFSGKTIKAIKNIFNITSPKKFKRITSFLFVVLNIYPAFLVIDWSYSSIANTYVLVPQNSFFDYLVIFPFWIFIFICVQAGLFFLLIDFFKLFLIPVYKKHKNTIKKIEYRFILIIAFVFTLYVPARIYYDYHTIDVREVVYHKKNLPDALNNFKIVLIADMQADRYTNKRRLNKFISDVNKANPDLVLIGGDLITSTPNYINEAAEYAGKIKSKYGVYSCVGDHDNWAYHNDYTRSLNEVTGALEKYNVEMINDSNKVLNIGNANIKITFVTNTYVEHVSNKILNRLTSGNKKYGLKILLVHQPRQKVVSEAVQKNYDLMLAGHTHGGQVTFLFPFKNLTPTLLETKYVRGDFKLGKTLLIVTRGLGVSLVPIRYNSTPEVTVIKIEK